MNLQINLLRASEQRSASVISIKFIALGFGILIPTVLIVMIGLAFFSYRENESLANLREQEWTTIDSFRKESAALNTRLRNASRQQKEIMGWNLSRLLWNEYLSVLQQLVPPEIQLRALQTRQTLSLSQGQPARMLTLTLGGRCIGPDAEERVAAFRRALAEHADVRRAEVTAFREDGGARAEPWDRIFQIEIQFKPRLFNEPPAPRK